jgi:hypothetical protein
MNSRRPQKLRRKRLKRRKLRKMLRKMLLWKRCRNPNLSGRTILAQGKKTGRTR